MKNLGKTIATTLITMACFMGAWIIVDLFVRDQKFTFKNDIVIPIIFFAVYTVISFVVKKVMKKN